jgi:hypothetical protein
MGARAAIVAHAAITKTDLVITLVMVDPSLSERRLPLKMLSHLRAAGRHQRVIKRP